VRFRPTGRHRAARTTALARPADAMVNDLAYCPAEETDRLHAFLATGGRVCWTCRTYTDSRPLTSAPRPGGAQ
jgi:hypothetical protein